MQWSIKTVATLYLFVCKHVFDWVAKPVVDNSSESTDTHLPECIASLILLLLFVNLQDFLVDLLYVYVGQEGCSLLANCLGMFPCTPAVWASPIMGYSLDAISTFPFAYSLFGDLRHYVHALFRVFEVVWGHWFISSASLLSWKLVGLFISCQLLSFWMYVLIVV